MALLLNGQKGGFRFDTDTSARLCRLSTRFCGSGDGAQLVAQVGDTIIQASAESDDGGVYLLDKSTGDRLRRLSQPDGDDPTFGTSVDVAGGIAAVGSPGEGGGGAVYLFDASTGSSLSKLNAPVGTTGFGYAIALNGNRLLVGAPGGDQAFLFDTETGENVQRFQVPDTFDGSDFGDAVALIDDVVAIGARVPGSNGGTTPVALLFDRDSGDFLGRGTLPTIPGGSTSGLAAPQPQAQASPLPSVPVPAAIWFVLSALGVTLLMRVRA